MKDFIRDAIEHVERAAELLDCVCEPAADTEYFFELISGAIFWKDESAPCCDDLDFDLVGHAIGAVRMLVVYRSAAMLCDEVAMATYEPAWDRAKVLMPNWIGFRPERCEAKPEYVQLLRERNATWVV